MKAQIPALLLAVLPLAGCMNGNIRMPYEPAAASPHPPARSHTRSYPRLDAPPRQLAFEPEFASGYARLRLQFPSAGANGHPGNLLTVDYFRGTRAGAKALVIVYPIWNSYTYPSGKITDTFLQRSDGSVSVLQIHGEHELIDWAALGEARNEAEFRDLLQLMVVSRVRTVVDDTRRLIDWAQAEPDIDPRRIGLVGFSVGAVVGSLVVSVEPRIAAAALVMGGARLHDVLTTCEGAPERLRRTIMERFGWSLERYRQVLEQLLAPLDVARHGGVVDAARIIVFDALFDTCMPATSRDALWRALGQPERISFLYDHKMAFLSLTPLGANHMGTRLYDFFQANFRREPHGHAAL